MNLILYLTNFAIGTCLASHAAVVANRFGKEDFIFKRSKCTNCGFELSLLDEIPIFSYFLLRGHCRYCHAQIPVELVIIEVIGGFAFMKVNLYTLNGIATAIVIFSLLLAAISDYNQMEFHLVMLYPAAILTIVKAWQTVPKFTAYDYIELLPILILLVYQVSKQKMGLGDLLIYLILAFYFQPEFANLTFLGAALLFLLIFCGEYKERDKQQEVAFIPYIFCGLIVQLLR
ncbi:prepilin peptidase [Lactobacillus sp. ESL0791]|uniref:prepilin peptidase n=1 Tax=Lactobacillus sp. ESL0791 TaxID=2983234 RepID=UPI0023F7BCC1|nr:prepilin peptidase [Lactobacillus sp. ESL0791]MDF7639458.1 prepilin peptidase [Lactobacillus sp. ESL0791]